MYSIVLNFKAQKLSIKTQQDLSKTFIYNHQPDIEAIKLFCDALKKDIYPALNGEFPQTLLSDRIIRKLF